MSSRSSKLSELHGELEAMGSIPLLPVEEFEEYATVCIELLGVTGELRQPLEPAGAGEDRARERHREREAHATGTSATLHHDGLALPTWAFPARRLYTCPS